MRVITGFRVGLSLGVVVSLAAVGAAPLVGQEPSPFAYRFAAPARVDFEPRGEGTLKAAVLIDSPRLPDGADGVTGWSVSVTSTAWEITGATLRATAAAVVGEDPLGRRRLDGFQLIETVVDDDGDRAPTVVSACILSLRNPIELDHAEDPQRILQLTLAGPVPPPGSDCVPVGLLFRPGRTGAGQPVLNQVTWRGDPVDVETVDAVVQICPRRISCADAPANLFLTTAAVDAPGARTDEVDSGLLTESVDRTATIDVPRQAGRPGELLLVANLSTRGVEPGVDAWRLSLSVRGNLDVTGATLDDTAADPLAGGFRFLDIVDAALPNGFTGVLQGQGVVSSVALESNGAAGALPPTGTATVLAVTLRERPRSGDRPGEGEVVWSDGLWAGPPNDPSQNAFTAGGEVGSFCARQTARVRFRIGEPFVRCDVDGSGAIDIVDPVRLLDRLFVSSRGLDCALAADCNSDGPVDVADAVFALGYLFLGRSQPGAPFPECGLSPDFPTAVCPPGSQPGCR